MCDLEFTHGLMDLLLSPFDIFCLFVIIQSLRTGTNTARERPFIVCGFFPLLFLINNAACLKLQDLQGLRAQTHIHTH